MRNNMPKPKTVTYWHCNKWISSEQRYVAFRLALLSGLDQIPMIVRDVKLDDIEDHCVIEAHVHSGAFAFAFSIPNELPGTVSVGFHITVQGPHGQQALNTWVPIDPHKLAIDDLDFMSPGSRTVRIRYLRGKYVLGSEFMVTSVTDEDGPHLGLAFDAREAEGVADTIFIWVFPVNDDLSLGEPLLATEIHLAPDEFEELA